MDLSIIIPVYNTDQYLRRCLDSIRETDSSSFEVLLIDDGSTDKSGSICDEYVSSDSRFRVIHKENGGVSVARNLGVHQVTGNFIWFLDSDDYLVPGAVKRCLELMQEYRDIDVFVSPMLISYEGREEEAYVSYQIEEPYVVSGRSLLMERNIQIVGPPQFLIRRSMFQSPWLTFPLGMRFEDEYFARVLKYLDGKFLILKEHLYVYRQWPGSHMNSLQVSNSHDIIRVYEQLDKFAGSEVSEQDQTWFRNNIVFFLLESYTRNKAFFSTEEFKQFRKTDGRYVRLQWKKYCSNFSMKDRILATVLLNTPSLYKKILDAHNSQKLKRISR